MENIINSIVSRLSVDTSNYEHENDNVHQFLFSWLHSMVVCIAYIYLVAEVLNVHWSHGMINLIIWFKILSC